MSEKANNLSTRCVVLVPLKRIDAARHVIQRFELQATIEHHPALAMAEICLHHLQEKNAQAWNSEAQSIRLLLVHASEIDDVPSMISSIHRYVPNVQILELRNGRLEECENCSSVVDALEEPPMIHSESVDADELSMLLDNEPLEVDEP